jgi:hypothetical protein
MGARSASSDEFDLVQIFAVTQVGKLSRHPGRRGASLMMKLGYEHSIQKELRKHENEHTR